MEAFRSMTYSSRARRGVWMPKAWRLRPAGKGSVESTSLCPVLVWAEADGCWGTGGSVETRCVWWDEMWESWL